MEADKRGSGYRHPNRWDGFISCTTLSMKCLKNWWQEGIKGELEAPYNLCTNAGSSPFSTCGCQKSKTCQWWPRIVWDDQKPQFSAQTLQKGRKPWQKIRSGALKKVEWHTCHLPATPASWPISSHLDPVLPLEAICQDERVRQKTLHNSPSL